MEFKTHPLSDPAAVVSWGNYRFSVITSRCIRIEYNDKKQFVDLPTLAFINRNLPVPKYEHKIENGTLTITTDSLTLTATQETNPPNSENLQITSPLFTWKFGDLPKQELYGSTRTLDTIKGSLPLGRGLCSRDGFSVIDDHKTPLILETGLFEPNKNTQTDLYFFGYGTDYKQCIDDFLTMSGKNPVLPRFSYGLWWSRYWPYTTDEMLAVADDFAAHDIPLSVYVIDMDWHITETGNESSGWTGWTFNKDLIPDPQRLFDELHKRNLAVTMNLHPADGIWPHECQYEEFAQKMGVTKPNPIKFYISDPKFMKNYFEILLHPYEKMGVNFWWIDWQQENDEQIDPLITLNHQHYIDNGKENTRPIILSRWCGYGGQRYPIGFSGDTIVEWESLQFQPYFSATASNVGFMYWSHDIGGHFGGHEDPELYLRWVQAASLLPIMRMHSSRNQFHERLPWGYEPTIEKLAIEWMKFHVALTPVFYSLSFESLIIRPMYHNYPKDDSAYQCPSQYMIGDDIIVAPFTNPIDKEIGQAFEAVWLPEGKWFDYQTGRQYSSGWHMIYGNLHSVPIFLKQGGVLPTLNDKMKVLTVDAFPLGESSFTVIDDDGISNSPDCSKTKISTSVKDGKFVCSFDITGDEKFVEGRTYVVKFRNVEEKEFVSLENCQLIEKHYCNKCKSLIVSIKREKASFSVSTNNNIYQYTKPTRDDIFQFVKAVHLNTWVKDVFFTKLEKANFHPLNDVLEVPERIRLHLAFFLLDFGFYRFPIDTGIDSFVVFNTGNVDSFRYTLIRTKEGVPTKVEEKVPQTLLFTPKEEKTVLHDYLEFSIKQTQLILHYDPINVNINFDTI